MQVINKDIDDVTLAHIRRLEVLTHALEIRKAIPYNTFLPDLLEFVPWTESECEVVGFNLYGHFPDRLKDDEAMAMWILETETLNRSQLGEYFSSEIPASRSILRHIAQKICVLDAAQQFGDGLKFFLPISGLWERAIAVYRVDRPQALSDALREPLAIFVQAHLQRSSVPVVTMQLTETVVTWLTEVALVCVSFLLGQHCPALSGHGTVTSLSMSEFFAHLRHQPTTSVMSLSMKSMSDLFAALSSPLVTFSPESNPSSAFWPFPCKPRTVSSRTVLFADAPTFTGRARIHSHTADFHASASSGHGFSDPFSLGSGSGGLGGLQYHEDEDSEIFDIIVHRDCVFGFLSTPQSNSSNSNAAFNRQTNNSSQSHRPGGKALKWILPLALAAVVPTRRKALCPYPQAPGPLVMLEIASAPLSRSDTAGVVNIYPQETPGVRPSVSLLSCQSMDLTFPRASTSSVPPSIFSTSSFSSTANPSETVHTMDVPNSVALCSHIQLEILRHRADDVSSDSNEGEVFQNCFDALENASFYHSVAFCTEAQEKAAVAEREEMARIEQEKHREQLAMAQREQQRMAQASKQSPQQHHAAPPQTVHDAAMSALVGDDEDSDSAPGRSRRKGGHLTVVEAPKQQQQQPLTLLTDLDPLPSSAGAGRGGTPVNALFGGSTAGAGAARSNTPVGAAFGGSSEIGTRAGVTPSPRNQALASIFG